MKVQRRYSICFTYAKRKPPPGVPAPKGGLLYLVLTAREPSVKPLADVMRDHICCDGHDQRRYILHIFTSLPVKMGGVGRKASITYFSTKRYIKSKRASPFGRLFRLHVTRQGTSFPRCPCPRSRRRSGCGGSGSA